MPTLSPPTSSNGTKAPTGAGSPPGLRVGAAKHRRALPRVGVGIVVVVGCALGFAATSLHVAGRSGVLELRQAVPAGGVFSSVDLAVVQVSAPGTAVLPVTAEESVVGRAAAVPLVAGSLLAPADLGPARVLPAGQAEVALALKPGGYPPDLAAGDHVLVVTASSTVNGAGTAANAVPLGPTPAVVAGVQPATATGSGDGVVTIQVGVADAPALADAAAAGQVSVVVVAPGGGGS